AQLSRLSLHDALPILSPRPRTGTPPQLGDLPGAAHTCRKTVPLAVSPCHTADIGPPGACRTGHRSGSGADCQSDSLGSACLLPRSEEHTSELQSRENL